MRELREILDEWAGRDGEPVVLATVVRTRGSAYRRPGARMLIAADGATVGSVSGGCLESQVAERAAGVMAGEGPALLNFDTTDPSDILFGTGTGCRGVVDLLLERVPARAGGEGPNLLRFASERLRRRETGVVATVLAAPLGAGVRLGDHLFVIRGRPEVETDLSDPGLVEALAAAAREGWAGKGSRLVTLPAAGGPVEVFLDRIEPPPHLMVFGAGYDAIPLVRMAGDLGYEVTVVDHRASFATARRFPQARAILVGRPAEVWDRLPLEAGASVAILTHNYALDRDLLERLLPLDLAYVGLLGPALRKDQILEEIANEGLEPAARSLARLHAPIGLDLGADTPETVALAILAEMQSVRAGHSGGPLRERQGPIHSAD